MSQIAVVAPWTQQADVAGAGAAGAAGAATLLREGRGERDGRDDARPLAGEKKKKNPLPVNDAVRVSVAALGLPTWG